jgi:hypothetical protein
MAIRHHSTDIDDTEVTEAGPSNTTPTSMDDRVASRGTDSVSRIQRTDFYIPSASVGLILGGILTLLISAWAAIVPFLGPTFGFSADGAASWTWNELHALGAVVPGALGILMCLIVLACARRPMGLQSAGMLATSGFVLFLCGAWLTVVPLVWPVLVGSYFHAASPLTTLEYWMGYASGPGLLMAAFGAMVIGRAGRESLTSQITLAQRI